MIQHSLKLLLGTTILGVCAANALAQTLPSTVDPSRVDDRLNAPAEPQAAPAPVELPQAAQVDNEAASQIFTLGNVRVVGVTIFPENGFSPLYQDLIGKQVSVADIQQIAATISAHYRKHGYVLSRAFVPNQVVEDDGIITIQVNEGYVSRVVYQGEPMADRQRTLVRWYADKIVNARPLKTDVLERYLLLMNDLPGKSVRGILQPNDRGPGSNDLVIMHSEDRFQGAVSVDNRGSRYVGPAQTSGTLVFNNVLGYNERTTVRGITSIPTTRELRFADIQQEHQIGTEGTKAIVTASFAKTQPGDALQVLNIEGKSENIAAKITHPFIRSRTENLTAHAGIDLRNSRTDILNSRLNSDRVRSLRAGASYDTVDRLDGINIVLGEVSQGVGLGATDDGAGRSRINGEHSYTHFNLDASRVQPLPHNLSLYTAMSGQYSLDPLLASEQFSIGGPAFGTYYDPAELSGDHGLAGKIELRYGNVISKPYMDSYQVYGYYDIGTVWLKDAFVGEDDRTSLASSGIGIRANITPDMTANAEFALPLTKDLAADRDNDGRFFGGLNYRF